MVLHALNTVFQAAPPQCWAAALDASGCFDVAVKIISAKVRRLSRSCRARADLEADPPERRQDTSALITTKCASCSRSHVPLHLPDPQHPLADLCAVARIILADPETFHHLVAATAARTGVSPDAIIDALLSQYVDRVRPSSLFFCGRARVRRADGHPARSSTTCRRVGSASSLRSRSRTSHRRRAPSSLVD